MQATYVSANSFTVSGDETANFIADRRIKADCGVDGIKYAGIVSSSYSAPNTTVTIDENSLTSNLTDVWYGVVAPGATGSLPKHSHSGSEGSGGSLSGLWPTLLTDLNDTPAAYDTGKYLRSTTSGTEWATVSGGSGTSDHSALINLDYASSGHTGFAPTSHTHTEANITDLDKYTQAEVDTISGTLQTQIDGKSTLGHTHTESDITDLGDYSTVSQLTTTSGYLQGQIDTISGTSDHSALINLDYASSGHTGFAPTSHAHTESDITDLGDYATITQLTTTSGDIVSQIPTDYYTTGQVDNLITTTSGYLQTQIDSKPDTLLELTDTPGTYSDGLYLRSTAGGTEWATVSGGGTTDHSQLSNLDYASSGHTGFVSTGQLTTTSGDLQTQIDNKPDTLLELSDTPGSYSSGLYLRSTADGTEWATVSGGSGSSTLVGLIDTPNSYSDGLYLKSTVSGTEWATTSGASTFLLLSDTPSIYSGFTEGNDSYTVLLLHMDDTNLSDSSTSNHTTVKQGSADRSATESKFGGYSLYLPGSGDYLQIADSDDWYFGSGDFTIELWVNFSSVPSRCGIIEQNDNSGTNDNLGWYISYNSGVLYFYHRLDDNSWGTALTYSWTPNTSQWYHIAVIRNGSTQKMFIDGSQVDSDSIAGTLKNATQPIKIGVDYNLGGTGYYLPGYVDEVRISKGIARWTSNFAPSSGAYGASIDHSGKYLRVNSGATGIAFEDGAFIDLSDTPTSYDNGLYLRSTVSGTEWTTTLSGTSLWIDGDATVTGTMYAHVYDSYSPLTIKDGGITVITGDGTGNIELKSGTTIAGENISSITTFSGLSDTPSNYPTTSSGSLGQFVTTNSGTDGTTFQEFFYYGTGNPTISGVPEGSIYYKYTV